MAGIDQQIANLRRQIAEAAARQKSYDRAKQAARANRDDRAVRDADAGMKAERKRMDGFAQQISSLERQKREVRSQQRIAQRSR
ncbi:MAG TPA: hypothetical protein VHD87_13005 [Acidimicrobiales bacterium]|nr:hypothetical protein [Acidimicrobiales bacterium]